jgi:CRISPR-associated protein Csm1
MQLSSAEQSLLYAWKMWDRILSTSMVALLKNRGYSIPETAPKGWRSVLSAAWEVGCAPTRLQSVLSILSLEEKAGAEAFCRLGTSDDPWVDEGLGEPTSDEIKSLASGVQGYLSKNLEAFDEDADPTTRISHLLALSQWAMSRISLHRDIADVSVFTLASTAAAVDTCLERAGEQASPLLLVGLDLSGIQKYIFTVRHSHVAGVGKRLRARSFSLGILMDSIILELLTRLKLPICQVLTRAGGQAFLLLPNTEATQQQLVDLQGELDQYCLKKYEGALVVHVAAQPLKESDLFDHYAESHRLVGEKLAERKRQPLQGALISGGTWQSEAFMPAVGSRLTRCASCQRVGTFAEMCPDCERDTRLGAILPRLVQVYLTTSKNNDALFGRWHLATQAPTEQEETIVLAFGEKLPNTNYPVWWSVHARHVPRDDAGGVLDFGSIAELSTGKSLLAYIKADVDRLGMLFAFGIPQSTKVAGVCRTRSLSLALEDLFSGYIQKLLTEEYSDVYTVFSGGDDLLLIAPWHVGVELALKLRSELDRRSGANPNVSLSAAVHYSKPKLPLATAVEHAENSLDEAKRHLRSDGRDRNQICVLGRPLAWAEAQKLLSDATMLLNSMQQGGFNSSMLQALMEMGLLYRSYKEKGEVTGLRFVSLLRYQMARWRQDSQLSKNASTEMWQWIEGLSDLNNNTLMFLPETLRQVHLAGSEKTDGGGI